MICKQNITKSKSRLAGISNKKKSYAAQHNIISF